MKPVIRDILPNLVDHLLDAVVIIDASGMIAYANAACQNVFGYSPEEMIGKAMLEYVAPEDRLRTLDEARLVMSGKHRVGFENRYIHKDGRYIDVMWSARWLADHQLRIGVARDVTEIRRAEKTQYATYAISEAVHDTADLNDLLQKVHDIISELMPISGFSVAICNSDSGDLDFTYQAGAGINPNFAEGGGHCLSMALDAPSGRVGFLVLRCTREVVFGSKEHELLHFMTTQLAIAIERMQLKIKTQHLAFCDELTGLPNRRSLMEMLNASLAQCRRHDRRIAVLFVDVDGLKQVNDTLGHSTGDKFLREFARRLENTRRRSDMVARFGGDEFVLLLNDVDGLEHVYAVANRINDVLMPPLVLDGRSIVMSASIGFAIFPDDGTEADQLLRHADSTMYSKKTSKRIGSV